MIYRVERIDEDDFGCEERKDGELKMAVVTLSDEAGIKKIIRVPDQELYDREINEGDCVLITEDGHLVKQTHDL